MEEKTPQKHKKMIHQLKTVEDIFNTNMKTKAEFEKQFIKMFKMQVDITAEDFDKLDLHYKLRFLCFFFFKFTNKNLVHLLFQDFWAEGNIVQRIDKKNKK